MRSKRSSTGRTTCTRRCSVASRSSSWPCRISRATGCPWGPRRRASSIVSREIPPRLMSDGVRAGGPAPPVKVTLGEIFRAFLLIGATSFGGGVMAYLRNSLVDKHGWIDDATFVQMLAMSQSLPGLNSTNMAGVCLPGGLIMFVIGMLHSAHGDRPLVTAMLHGVAAAAVGLVAAVSVQIGRKVLTRIDDLVFVALAVIGVNVFHLSVLVVLAGLGALAIWWHRPRTEAPALS